jgi:hypothetical protein
LGFYSLMNKLLNLETERARITEKWEGLGCKTKQNTSFAETVQLILKS